jgi:hypothetical protein
MFRPVGGCRLTLQTPGRCRAKTTPCCLAGCGRMLRLKQPLLLNYTDTAKLWLRYVA